MKKDYIKFFIEETKEQGVTDREELIDYVCNTYAEEMSYNNDFAKYQGINRNNRKYHMYYYNCKKFIEKNNLV